MHYAFSMRTDTPYWRWCTQENDYRPEIFDRHVLKEGGWVTILSNLTLTNTYPENMPGATFITAGLGIKSVSTKEITETIFKLHKIVSNFCEDNFNFVNNMQSKIIFKCLL